MNDRMKILFITSSSINGGAQKHIREMFKSLTRRGHSVYLTAPAGWLPDELKEYSDRVVLTNVNVRNVSKLEELLDKIKPDITNTFILSGGVFGIAAWKKRKYGKIFVTVNNPVIYDGISTIGRIAYPRMYRWMSKYASAFLVKADKVRDEVAEVIRNKKPVISIKNGIDFSVFDKDKKYLDIRTHLGISQDDIVVTNIAALDVRKGQEYLIKAAVELRKKYFIHVLLVGEGEDEERLKLLVRKNEAEGYIHFLGRRSDINCILSNTDIFVLSSIHEGLPNALMEAMAMGLPCVATDVGGVRQLIDSEDKGIVIHSKSSMEIIDAVIALVDAPNTATLYGRNSYEKISIEYCQEMVTTELINVYRYY